jgi:dolichol-phosphate mannosyltransferase
MVTGASGFVGANLVRRLLDDGHEVHALLRRGYRAWRLEDLRSRLRLHEVQLLDAPALEEVVAGIGPHWVFHLAAYGGYPEQAQHEQMANTNILATMNLVESCTRVGFDAFVNAGSSSEYGFKDHAPSETEDLEPNSPYAVTKAAATLYCQCLGKTRGLPIVTLRLYSVFGPFEEPSRFLPSLVLRGLAGSLPPLVGPDTARDFVYVDDVVEAFILAAKRPHLEPGAVYNVGSGVQTTIREVVALARRELAVAARPKWGSMAQRRWDTTIWVANTGKIREVLGWHPQVGFAEAFRLTVEWFRRNWPPAGLGGDRGP